jgi:hypothetical protein
MLTYIVNRADIGMIQCGGRPRFTPETLERLRIVAEVFWEEFERYEAPEPEVFGSVHHAHPPAAELL